MNEFIVIDVMNESMIKLLQEKNENCEKNLLIREYLKDESIFFKMSQTKACKILQAVGIKKDQLNNTYTKLTTQKIFYDLLRKGIIKADDENLVINYTKSNNNNVF